MKGVSEFYAAIMCNIFTDLGARRTVIGKVRWQLSHFPKKLDLTILSVQMDSAEKF